MNSTITSSSSNKNGRRKKVAQLTNNSNGCGIDDNDSSNTKRKENSSDSKRSSNFFNYHHCSKDEGDIYDNEEGTIILQQTLNHIRKQVTNETTISRSNTKMSSLTPSRRSAAFARINGSIGRGRMVLSRDGPLIKFIVSNYRAILLLMVTGIAINTIRMGISSLDIGVRTKAENHHHSQYPTSHDSASNHQQSLLEPSSSEDRGSTNKNNIFSTTPIVRSQVNDAAGKDKLDFGEQPATTDGGLVGDLLDWDALEQASNQNLIKDSTDVDGSSQGHGAKGRSDSTSTKPGKISSAAAMGLGSFQIPPFHNIEHHNQQQHHHHQQQHQTNQQHLQGTDASPLVGGRKNVMVIGGMGFIGFHTCLHLKQLGHFVMSYDVQTDTPTNVDKLNILQNFHGIPTIQGDSCDSSKLYSTLEHFQITHVIYLASQSYERGQLLEVEAALNRNNNNNNVSYIEEGTLGTIPSDEGGNIIVDLTPAELESGIDETAIIVVENTSKEEDEDYEDYDLVDRDEDEDDTSEGDEETEEIDDNVKGRRDDLDGGEDAPEEADEDESNELVDEDDSPDTGEESESPEVGADEGDLDESPEVVSDENGSHEIADEDELHKIVDGVESGAKTGKDEVNEIGSIEDENESLAIEEDTIATDLKDGGVEPSKVLRGALLRRRRLESTENTDLPQIGPEEVNNDEEDQDDIKEEGEGGGEDPHRPPHKRSASFSFSSLPSPTHAFEYPPNNLDCFATLLDIVRRVDLHVVYASSSHGYQFQDRGVYQYMNVSSNSSSIELSMKAISKEEVPHPSMYHPKIKRSNELMAETYSLLYDISSVGIRFPTVYGPFGRPNFTYYQYMRAVGSFFPSTSLSEYGEDNVGDASNSETPSTTAATDSETKTKKVKVPYIMTRDNIDSIVKQEQQLSLIHVDDAVRNLVAALDLTQEGAMVLTVGRACATSATTVIQMMEQSLRTIREEQQQLQQEQQMQHGNLPPNVNENMIDSEYANSEQLIDRSMDPQAQRQVSNKIKTNDNGNPIESNVAAGEGEINLISSAKNQTSTTNITDSDVLRDESQQSNQPWDATTFIDYVDVTQEPLMSTSTIFTNMTSPRCREGKTHGEIPLWDGIQALMYWYAVEGGKERDMVLLRNAEEEEDSVLPDKTITDDTTVTQDITQTADKDDARLPLGPPTDICHVTASFAEDVDKADKVPPVSHLSHEHPNRYFFFTNLPDIECDGWERIVLNAMPFRRFITQSRWPKFMGWLHPALKDCKVIYYADAIWRPRDLPMTEWETLANMTLASDAGILQQIRPFNHSGMRELNFIKSHRKDIKRNVAASREWFLSRPDFNNTSLSYRNNAFVYDPHNPNFRLLMTSFWTHYSQEEDSWRDQPLYRYLVNKLQLTPALYPKNKSKTAKKLGQVKDYWEEKGKKGYNGHHYKDKDDANAG